MSATSPSPAPREAGPTAIRTETLPANPGIIRPGLPGEINPVQLEKRPDGSAALAWSCFCLIALACLYWALRKMNLGHVYDLFPVLVLPIVMGLAAVAVRWRLGSVMLILTVAVLIVAKRIRVSDRGMVFPPTTVFFLCSSLLAFVAAHYRLMGVVKPRFPPLPRGRRKEGPGGRMKDEGEG